MRGDRRRRRRASAVGQRGAATILVIALAGVLLMIGAGLGVVAAMVADHRRAQSAADLAALAGAGAVLGGDPCAEAATIAGHNGATVTSCAVQGRDVVVEVMVEGSRWLWQTGDLVARARAGPG